MSVSVSRNAAGKRLVSKSKFKTVQEDFWAGNFGDGYISRNESKAFIASNVAMFSKILDRAGKIRSAIEFGANVGLNMHALRALVPEISLTAVEINKKAVAQLRKIGRVEVRHESILEFSAKKKYELSFTKGVLISHCAGRIAQSVQGAVRQQQPVHLRRRILQSSPVAILYRGHADRLFKRDFAGELLEKYRDLRLVDYGFVYRRDPNFPQDDMTWFLLEKGKSPIRPAANALPGSRKEQCC